jgi:hypothetical protein
MTDRLFARRAARGYAPEALAHAKHRYEDTDEPQESIAADLRIHRKSLDRLAKKEGWKLRKDRPPRELPPALQLSMQASEALAEPLTPAASIEVEANPSPVPPQSDALATTLAGRLEVAVEKELQRVETLRIEFGSAAHRAIEAERTARTLATLTETLFKVRRLREAGASPLTAADDEMPADAELFRCELARRIEAFVRGRDDGRLSAGVQPADAGDAGA